jgi:hypothetical protein
MKIPAVRAAAMEEEEVAMEEGRRHQATMSRRHHHLTSKKIPAVRVAAMEEEVLECRRHHDPSGCSEDSPILIHICIIPGTGTLYVCIRIVPIQLYCTYDTY